MRDKYADMKQNTVNIHHNYVDLQLRKLLLCQNNVSFKNNQIATIYKLFDACYMILIYVDMREKYADMRPFYVYIKLNYVDKQLIYISMQFIYIAVRR